MSVKGDRSRVTNMTRYAKNNTVAYIPTKKS